MQIMRVDVADIGRQLACHDESLAQSPDAVGRQVAFEIGPERPHEFAHGGLAHGEEHAAQHPHGFLVEIFRQVGHRSLDLPVHGMNGALGRMTQRPDFEIDPACFEREDFLRDESFRQARITLDDDSDASGLVRRQQHLDGYWQPRRQACRYGRP